MVNSFGLDNQPLRIPTFVWLVLLLLIASLCFGYYYLVLIVYSVSTFILSLLLLWAYFTESNDFMADILYALLG